MSTVPFSQAQMLASDALVELYEIDTTALTNVQGTPSAGQTYLFTPGGLPTRYSGHLVAANTTVLTFDQFLPITTSSGYALAVDLPGAPYTVLPFNVVGTNGALGTDVALVTPLAQAPPIGARWVLTGPGVVSFGGASYTPFPITVSGYEKSGQGKLARPKLVIDNTILFPGTNIPMAAAMVIQFADALGARITRLRVFANNLDGAPGADSSATFDPDIFYIDRKSSHTREAIEFELTSDFDQIGLRLPARQIIRDTCTHTYRRWNPAVGFVYGTCPYNAAFYFKYDDTGTSDPAQDVCGKRFNSCKTRFGTAPLPARFFPGAGLTRV